MGENPSKGVTLIFLQCLIYVHICLSVAPQTSLYIHIPLCWSLYPMTHPPKDHLLSLASGFIPVPGVGLGPSGGSGDRVLFYINEEQFLLNFDSRL